MPSASSRPFSSNLLEPGNAGRPVEQVLDAGPETLGERPWEFLLARRDLEKTAHTQVRGLPLQYVLEVIFEKVR